MNNRGRPSNQIKNTLQFLKQANRKVCISISIPSSLLQTIEKDFQAKSRSEKIVDCLLIGLSYYTEQPLENLAPKHRIAQYKMDVTTS